MATQPIINPKFRAFDSNGDPLSGGLLYTYSAGTSTPLATYTTRAGSVANANPVALDANGEADVWTTPSVDYKFELRNSAGVVQWTVDNYPSPADDSATTADVATEPGGRLSLSSLTPVSTSDVTGATTVYYSPYRHNRVPLYDGSAWALYSIGTELSQTTTDTTKSPAAVTTDSNYDLFVWNDSGTLRLSRGPAWSSANSRGSGAGTTEIGRVDGRWTNKVSISNGPAAQRGLYVGTIRTDGSSQVNDSLAKRHVWNTYNRVRRAMRVIEATVTWNYTTATWRQANGSASNQLNYLQGLAEDSVSVRAVASVVNTAAAVTVSIAIGVDSASNPTDTAMNSAMVMQASDAAVLVATYEGYPGVGQHFIAWLEYSTAVGTTTWRGTDPFELNRSGIDGALMG